MKCAGISYTVHWALTHQLRRRRCRRRRRISNRFKQQRAASRRSPTSSSSAPRRRVDPTARQPHTTRLRSTHTTRYDTTPRKDCIATPSLGRCKYSTSATRAHGVVFAGGVYVLRAAGVRRERRIDRNALFRSPAHSSRSVRRATQRQRFICPAKLRTGSQGDH